MLLNKRESYLFPNLLGVADLMFFKIFYSTYVLVFYKFSIYSMKINEGRKVIYTKYLF